MPSKTLDLRKLLVNSLYTMLFFLSSFFASCSDDTVTPTQSEFDPPRYDWEMDTLFADIADIWAADSSNVFFVSHLNNLYYYNGHTYQNYNYGINNGMSYIDGFDRNNVFLGGNTQLSQGIYHLKILKWNGNGFENFLTADSSLNEGMRSMYVRSQNEIWFGTSKGRLYKTNGINTETFYFDTCTYINSIFEDAAANICFVGNAIYPEFQNPDSMRTFINRYENNVWVTLFDKTYHENEYQLMYSVKPAGNQILGVGFNSVNIFNNNQFQNITALLNYQFFPDYYAISPDNLLVGAIILNGSYFEVMHWNGSKWSNEGIKFYDWPVAPFGVNNFFIICSYDIQFGRTFIFKGTLKH